MTAPRVRSFNILKTDSRVSSAWTLEGAIYYVWKEDSKIYSLRGFYEGGSFLVYSSNVMMSRFYPRDFQQSPANPPNVTFPEKPEKVLSFLCLNVHSLNKHLEDLEALVYCLESPRFILCLTKTWLTKNDNDQNRVTGYTEFEASNRSNRSRGAMIQVREKSNTIQTYESPFEESVFVLINTFGFRFRLYCIFNPSRNNKIDFVHSFDQFLEKLTSEKTPP